MTVLSDSFASRHSTIALAAALAHAGYPCILRHGGEEAVPSPETAGTPRFAIHLTATMPLDTLLHALAALKNGRAPALLLTAERTPAPPYREQLRLDRDGNLLGITRQFRAASPVRERTRANPVLAGVIWKMEGRFRDISPGARPWSTARRLLRRDRRAIPRLPTLLPSASYFTAPVPRPRPVYAFTKRCFDIAFALCALLITLPICLAAALAIKLYDRGPIFFIHRREGRHAKPFGCIKFRTMVRDAAALQAKLRTRNQVDGPQFKIARDPRITPVGRFLRKSNIDELPQFLNVLMGQMSVVGPRPSPFEENQLCPPWREARLSVKPGITGLWQVSRSRARGAADFQEWIMYDTQYVERRGTLLDLKILLLTMKELFGNGQ